GHAMEVRLCAEDPAADFMPQTGRIRAWRVPTGRGIRADHCVQAGGEVSPFYDSMIGKIIAWGVNRDVARMRLIAALDRTLFLGLTHNKSFLTSILRSNIFAGGDFDIHFIDKHMPSATTQNTQPATRHVALAGIILHAHAAMQLAQQHDLQHDQLNWRSSNAAAIPGKLGCGGTAWHLRLDASPDD